MVATKDIDITHLPIGDLRPDPANPRRISDEELESLTRSIREFGLIDPIIARREDKVVIGGHQRLLAARKLRIKQVPVVLVDLSDEEAHLLNLALNRISGSWDQELLARLLGDLKAVPDVDLSLSGFSDEELQKHLKSLESREKRERLETFDLDEAMEAAQSAPVAHTFDVWLLGETGSCAAIPPTVQRCSTGSWATTTCRRRSSAGNSRMTIWLFLDRS